jgi:Cu+-exporting ATPase
MNVLDAAAPARPTDAAALAAETPTERGRGLRAAPREDGSCFHCGSPCPSGAPAVEDRRFCCQGCQTVYELLTEKGLGQFYELAARPGIRVGAPPRPDRYACLDDPTVASRLLDFSDGKVARVTFQVPAIHCIACVWLLESLFRFHAGIGRSQVNFLRREVSVVFEPGKVSLGKVASLLASLGYEPRLTLADVEQPRAVPSHKRLYLQVGIAGFVFGNTMLFSLASYFGMDPSNGHDLKGLFGYLSLLLSLPVVGYSAADYWRAAAISLRRRMLTIEVPIAIGIAALFLESAAEILSGTGEGFLDSLAGLMFFLLCGRIFQRKTYDRLAFDRDYRCFFPLSVVRKNGDAEEQVPIAKLRRGDRLVLRNGELIPADARLVSGPALIDYSFVTGESEPVAKAPGDYLYAGGHQVGGAIAVETVKPVSQSYLTSLWNDEAFRKRGEDDLPTLTNQFSRRFTVAVLGIATVAGLGWALVNPELSVRAFASVLIVACPCALALAAPFALGTAQRWLGRAGVYLKNPLVLERMARVDAIVFDKTGTLTVSGTRGVRFEGEPLSDAEAALVGALARHSLHPHAVRIAGALGEARPAASVSGVQEVAGSGLAGTAADRELRLGSRAWLMEGGVDVPAGAAPEGSAVWVAIDGRYRGRFVLSNTLRPDADRLLAGLRPAFEVSLLSGDNEKERLRFGALFGEDTRLHFNQSPLDKLGFVRRLQSSGRRVMMVGDGLNDAGALRQSDVGVAVVETAGAFSPASDVILSAALVSRLGEVLRFARQSVRIVRLSFVLSSVYNVIGISIAARGQLSPAICALLMPLSSATVVAFACGATAWLGRRAGLPAAPAS